jgi:hypothetical protein
LEADTTLKRYVESVVSFYARKSINYLNLNSQEVLFNYIELAKEISDSIARVLPQLSIQLLKPNDWYKIRTALSSDDTDLPPTFLVNLAWIKRLETIKNDININILSYYKNRIYEPQIIENIIELIYKHYVLNIVPKVRGDIDDLCIVPG